MNRRLTRFTMCALSCAPAVLAQPQQFSRSVFENLPAAQGEPLLSLTLPMDVDGDGRPDLVQLGGAGPSRWLRQTAPRRFVEAGPVAVGLRDLRVAFADLDGDGTDDLLAGAAGDPVVEILLSDSTPLTGVDTTISVVVSSTTSIATGDVDADGDIDVIVGEELFTNDGRARFTARPSAIPPTVGAENGRLADLDGDGDLDFVRTPSFGRATQVLLNDGGGTFRIKPNAITPSVNSFNVLVIDADHDGDFDLVLPKPVTASPVMINDGTGSFTAGPTLPKLPGLTTALDLSGDGRPDLLMILGTGNLAFESTPNGFVRSSTALPPEFLPGFCCPADLDGDGDADLPGTDQAWLKVGAEFVEMPDRPAIWGDAAILDVNGDGLPDLLGQQIWGTEFAVSVNDGSGRFGRATPIKTPPSWNPRRPTRSFVAGDVDNDGDLDLIQRAGGLGINDGDGNFSAGVGLRTRFSDIALGDLDGDGDLDATITGATSGPQTYSNDGSANFTLWQSLPIRQNSAGAARHADLDSDGDLDLLTTEPLGNGSVPPMTIYWNDGSGAFVLGPRILATGNWTGSVELGDLDGDGDIDVLASTVALENLGQGRFRSATQLAGIGTPALVDVDNDGDLDVWSRTPNRLFRNDGGWFFTEITSSVPGNPADAPLTFGDVDGDGDVDALAESGVLLNNHRQIRLRYLTAPGESVELELSATPGYGQPMELALPWIAARTASVDLGSIGILRIDLSTAVPLAPVWLTDPDSRTTVILGVPNDPSLAGKTLHAQAVIASSSASGLRLRLTGRERIDLLR